MDIKPSVKQVINDLNSMALSKSADSKFTKKEPETVKNAKNAFNRHSIKYK
jgi:hypothetical protein